jgi:hypothetical protein
MILVDMEVQDIKFICRGSNLVQHQHIIGKVIEDVPIEAKSNCRTAHQLRRRNGVARGEQRHLVA